MRILHGFWLMALLGAAACTTGTPTGVIPQELSAPELAFVEGFISDNLRDPTSAQFRRVTGYALANGDRVACGEVNGTNGFGGYVGFVPFFVRFAGQTVKRIALDDTTGYGFAAIGCQDAASGMLSIGAG